MTILDLVSNVKGTGAERGAPCPACGGEDRFRIWVNEGRVNQRGEHIGRFWCRRCRIHGDAIDFLQEFEGMTWKEAAKAVDADAKRILRDAPDKRDINAAHERYLARVAEMDAEEIMAETRAEMLRQMKTCPSHLLVDAIARTHRDGDTEAHAHLLGIVRWRLSRLQWLLQRYHKVHRGQVEAYLRSEQSYPVDVFFRHLGIDREMEGWMNHGESWERYGEWIETDSGDEFEPDWDTIHRFQAKGRHIPQSLMDYLHLEEIK